MIWLIGNNGMLGKQISELLQQEEIPFVGTDVEVDITNLDTLAEFAEGKDIQWIVNCSAYTAVDKAEKDEERARSINGLGVGNIAKVAAANQAKVVHFSTDYVYDGEKEGLYDENDPTNPVSAYGRTKLEGENLLRNETDRFFIIRISWLYGVHGPNFVKTMLRLFAEKEELNVIHDQVGAPTYARQLAINVVSLIRRDSDAYGIYCYADEGELSWYDFAQGIRETGLKHGYEFKLRKLNPIPSSDYPLPAKRPANSRFDKTSTKKRLYFEVVDWKTNLSLFFEELPKETT